MGLVGSVIWPKIYPYINAKPASPDSAKSRARLEMKPTLPTSLAQEALAFEMPCVNCGLPIHPFRQRHPGGRDRVNGVTGIYIGVTCDLGSGRLGCRAGNAATTEYASIRAALAKAPPPPSAPVQGDLLKKQS